MSTERTNLEYSIERLFSQAPDVNVAVVTLMLLTVREGGRRGVSPLNILSGMANCVIHVLTLMGREDACEDILGLKISDLADTTPSRATVDSRSYN